MLRGTQGRRTAPRVVFPFLATIGVLVVGALLLMPLMSDAASTTTTSTTPSTTPTTTTTTTPPPPAPKPPLASTGYAPEVTETTASVRGSVTPRGVDTSSFFQYGPSATYGWQTSATPVGAGTQEVKVVQALAGLTPNTTYHYRIVAVSAAGTTMGQDHAFTTRKIPLKITISATPNPTLFGARFVVRGTISGSEAGGQWVVLQANPFPYHVADFVNVGVAEQTDAAGNFTMPVDSLLRSSRLRVAVLNRGNAISQPVTELVAVRVSFHARRSARAGYERLYGSVSPPVAGARVSFQWLRRGHHPSWVGGTVVHRGNSHASHFSRVLALHHRGHYRAIVRVKGGGLLSHYSSSILTG